MYYSNCTPFVTFSDIKRAVTNKTATLSFRRSAAYQIASTYNGLFSLSIIIIPIISLAFMLIVCMLLSISMWVMLFGVVALLGYIFIPHIKYVLLILAAILIALPLLFFSESMWLFAIGVGIIGMIIGYYIWWGIISGIATKALLNNETAFEELWKARCFAIKTKLPYGFYTYTDDIT